MKLSDLNPQFVGHGGDGITRDGKPVPRREGMGISFDCPCGCETPVFVHFENPLDGGLPLETTAPKWHRTGEQFETMTLSPSLLRMNGCKSHFFVRNGEIIQS